MTSSPNQTEENDFEGQPAPARNVLKVVFLSGGENRLRAGWRLLLQVVLLILLLFGLQFALDYYLLDSGRLSPNVSFFSSQALTLVAITLSVFFARVILDQRSLASLGLTLGKKTWLELGLGMLIAGLVMGVVFLVEWSLGWLKVEGAAWSARPLSAVAVDVLVYLAAFLGVGWGEELLFRGYWLQNLEEGLNLPWAVGLSSLLFAAAHWANPRFSMLPLAGLLLSSLLLVFGYLVTRRLWLPIGLHIGWNMFQGVIFGFPVGGMSIPPLIEQTVTGPALWTGGEFGPDGGLIILPALALGGFLIWAYQVYCLDTD